LHTSDGELCRPGELFKAAVGVEKREDPIPVSPEVGGAVIDLGRRSLNLMKLSAKEIVVIPISPRLFVVVDENGMGLAEFSEAVRLLPAELFQYRDAGVGVYLVAEEEQVEFQEAREFRFLVSEEIDLGGVIGETVHANLLFYELPIVGGDAVAVVGLDCSGGFAFEPADRPDHFFVELQDRFIHGWG
jgi:hypothetical protein